MFATSRERLNVVNVNRTMCAAAFADTMPQNRSEGGRVLRVALWGTGL